MLFQNIGQPDFSLIFTLDGRFVQKEEDVPLHTAPKKILDVIESNYSDYITDNQIEKLTLADNTIQYLVDITKAETTKELILSINDEVICEN